MIEQLENEKTCGGGCCRTLPLSCYAPRKDRPSGYRSECRDCSKAAQAKRDARKLIGPKDFAEVPYQPEASAHRIWQAVRLPVYEAANFGTYRINQGVAA